MSDLGFDGSTGDGHVLLLHRSEARRVDGVSAWVRRGLDRRDQVIYPRGEQDHDEIRLLTSLGGVEDVSREAVAAAVADGRVLVLGEQDYYPAGLQRELVRRALGDGFAGVRMVGEASSALSMLGPSGYRAFEREMDRLCDAGSVCALCTYDEDVVPRELVVGNVGAHSSGLRSDILAAARGKDALHVAGELDASNADLLQAALAAAAGDLDGQDTVRVVLAGLTFCDVAGARAILAGTRELRGSGGRLDLLASSPPVRRLLTLLGVAEEPGVTLVSVAG